MDFVLEKSVNSHSKNFKGICIMVAKGIACFIMAILIFLMSIYCILLSCLSFANYEAALIETEFYSKALTKTQNEIYELAISKNIDKDIFRDVVTRLTIENALKSRFIIAMDYIYSKNYSFDAESVGDSLYYDIYDALFGYYTVLGYPPTTQTAFEETRDFATQAKMILVKNTESVNDRVEILVLLRQTMTIYYMSYLITFSIMLLLFVGIFILCEQKIFAAISLFAKSMIILGGLVIAFSILLPFVLSTQLGPGNNVLYNMQEGYSGGIFIAGIVLCTSGVVYILWFRHHSDINNFVDKRTQIKGYDYEENK